MVFWGVDGTVGRLVPREPAKGFPVSETPSRLGFPILEMDGRPYSESNQTKKE